MIRKALELYPELIASQACFHFVHHGCTYTLNTWFAFVYIIKGHLGKKISKGRGRPEVRVGVPDFAQKFSFFSTLANFHLIKKAHFNRCRIKHSYYPKVH